MPSKKGILNLLLLESRLAADVSSAKQGKGQQKMKAAHSSRAVKKAGGKYFLWFF